MRMSDGPCLCAVGYIGESKCAQGSGGEILAACDSISFGENKRKAPRAGRRPSPYPPAWADIRLSVNIVLRSFCLQLHQWKVPALLFVFSFC